MQVLHRRKVSAANVFTTVAAVKPSRGRQVCVVMMKTLFTSSSGSDSISCGFSKMHCRGREMTQWIAGKLINKKKCKKIKIKKSGDGNGAAKTTQSIC